MKILITGVAGFIGNAVAKRLLEAGYHIVGLDNLSDYYDVNLKEARLQRLNSFDTFEFVKLDVANREGIKALFSKSGFDKVIHLAAQAGVRYSIENPTAYIDSNLVGFSHILEGCRHHKIKHLVYASSSSVYGANTKLPFSEHDNIDHPVSLYAATKKSNELMAHSYASLYHLPVTGLRFFTVYGPWGRPDMALFKFTKSIINDQPIEVYNHGDMIRDFTYIDDIVTGIILTLDKIATPNSNWDGDCPDPATSYAPYRVYNIGNHAPVKLIQFIEAIETALDKKANKKLMDMQPGDVPATFADVSAIEKELGFKPSTSIEYGIQRFIDWYCQYYDVVKDAYQ